MPEKKPWHALTAETAIQELGSHAAHGLSSAEAEERTLRFGKNTLPEPKRRSLAAIFLHQFASPLSVA
jgi:Ca2+-transporting ATPase